MKFVDQIQKLNTLIHDLESTSSVEEELEILDQNQNVRSFIKNKGSYIADLPSSTELICKKIIALGQDHLFGTWNDESIQKIASQLLNIDQFYTEIGGILGYHFEVLKLLEKKESQSEDIRVFPPSFVDIREEDENVRESTLWGIEFLPLMAEFYPLGGAADRLHLVDEKTGSDLPAAKLQFLGKSLLEHLIADLQAKEALYEKIYKQKIITPIVIMSSEEKSNHRHVLEICEENDWFGRGKENFFIFIQPLVPTITEEGSWCMKSEGDLLLKPGGHGALWKLARDQGVLAWLKEKGRTKALVRQINNPLAGLDYGLLAFAGWGCKKEKKFGFSSCPRLVGTAEGVNLLIEKKKAEGYEFYLSNVEYCDFQKWGIEDIPESEGGKYSRYASNANILFVDLEAIEEAVGRCPFPGMLINLKEVTVSGKTMKVARLESTMQNIADALGETSPTPFQEGLNISNTFACYNHRHKTISPAKRAYVPGRTTMETPERALYDLLRSYRELLQKHCSFELPLEKSFEEYLAQGPSSLFYFHPSLGPLFSLIGQKIQGGVIHTQSEMILDLSELSIRNLELNGSLIITADSLQKGRCVLENVSVENEGIDWKKSENLWKGDVLRKGSLKITLHGSGQFYAKDVTFAGSYQFEVPNEQRLTVSAEGEDLRFTSEPIGATLPLWTAEIQDHSRIILK